MARWTSGTALLLPCLWLACAGELSGSRPDGATPTDASADGAGDLSATVDSGPGAADGPLPDAPATPDHAAPDLAPAVTQYKLGVPGKAYDLATDGKGAVHLLWYDGALNHGLVAAGKVSGKVTLPGSTKINIRFARPRLSVKAGGGSLHTCWTNAGAGTTLYHGWRTAGGKWARETVWTSPTGTHFVAAPVVAVDGGDNLHLIAQLWQKTVHQSPIVYWRKPSGGAWPKEVTVQQPGGKQWRDTSMFTDGAGAVHAAWKTAGKPGRYHRCASGGSLAKGAPLQIQAPAGEKTVSFGDLFVDAAGTVHHVFIGYPKLGMWYATLAKGGAAFSKASRAGTCNNAEKMGYENPWPAVVGAPGGRAVVAWAENRGGGKVPYVMVSTLSKGKWTAQTFQSAAGIHVDSKPALALTAAGVHLVWRAAGGDLRLAVFKLP